MEKIKSKGWVGNIYHKFEAMCQEVDGFVTKDTVKYVENQVQTVGQSMKKLYSGVVQDFLIPTDNPVKREPQAADGEQKYTVDTSTTSLTGTTQNLVNKQSSLDQDVDNSLESHDPSTSTERDGPVVSEAVENDTSLGTDSIAATCKISDKVFEENVTREDKLVDEELISPEDRISSESCSDKESKDTMCDSFINDRCFSDVSISQSCKSSRKFFEETVTREDKLVDEKLSTMEDRISSESCSEKDFKDTMCYSFSDDDRCFSDVSSSQIILQDDIVGENQPLAEGSSLFVEKLSESPLGDFENEKMFDCSPDANNCVSSVPSSQIALQQNITREVHPVTDQSNSFGDMILSLSLPFSMEEGHGNSITSKFPHPSSLYDTEIGTFPEDERRCKKYFDAAESISSVSITQTILQETITSEGQFAPRDSSSARDESFLQIPAFASDVPPASLNDAGVEVSVTVCNSCIDDVTCVSDKSSSACAFDNAPSAFQPPELVLSRVLPDNESVDIDAGVSNSSLLAQSSNLSTSIANCMEPESDSSISTGLSSSLSTPFMSSANNVVTVIPALASTASVTDFSDVNAYSSHESLGYAGAMKSDLEWCPCPQLKALTCPTEIGCMNDCCVDLPGMETVDLTDKGKLEGSCVLVDNKLHSAVSFRPRKYKSYKELLQEAFASRNRLIKEYKQLAIQYADVDAETSQHAEHSQFPSLPLTCLHSTESAVCNICESEWELL